MLRLTVLKLVVVSLLAGLLALVGFLWVACFGLLKTILVSGSNILRATIVFSGRSACIANKPIQGNRRKGRRCNVLHGFLPSKAEVRELRIADAQLSEDRQ